MVLFWTLNKNGIMKKALLILLTFNFLFMKCRDTENLSPSDCSDKNAVLKVANKIAEKKLGNDIDNFEIKVEEEENFYTVTYTNREALKDPLKKGGGDIFLKISKRDCKIIDYKKFK